MRIIKNPSNKLGAKGGASLMKYVEAALNKDKEYFDFFDNLRNLLSGKHWENVTKARPKQELKMVVNLAHAHVRSMVPTLFFKDPQTDCLPTMQQHVGKEKTWNAIINNTLEKIGFKKEFKKAVLDAVTYPEAVIKDVVNRSPEEDQSDQSEQDYKGPTAWLSKGSPAHIRHNPKQLLVDPLASDRELDNARFIALRYKKTFQELKNHPIYGKNVNKEFAQIASARENLTTGNLVDKSAQGDGDNWDKDDKFRKIETNEEEVTIYEVWIHQLIDVEGEFKCYQQMCVLMEGQDEPIRELETWEDVMGTGFNRYPITRIVLLPVPDSIPSSELGTWQGIQMAMDWLVSRLVQLVENDRLLYLVDPAKVKNYNKFKQQFYKGRSRELVEVVDNAGAVELAQPSFVGRDNYSLLRELQSLQQQIAGVGQNRRGGSGIRTASEANIIEQGTQIKTDEKVDVIADALKEIITKQTIIIRHLVATSGEGVQFVFRVGGDIGAVKWTNFTRQDVDWLPEVIIRANSFRKMDSMQDMQKFLQIIQVGGQMSAQGVPVRNDILFSRFLESAGVHDPARIVGNQDQDSMLQSAELAAMMAGIETPVLESHNDPVHLQAMEAFEQTEIGQTMLQNQGFLAAFEQHKEEHTMAMQAKQQKANEELALGQNPFQGFGTGQSENPTPQSMANQETAASRTATSPIPGTTGELNL